MADKETTSFMRSLCMGRIEQELIFPFPTLSESEKETLTDIAGALEGVLAPRREDFRKWDEAGEFPSEFIDELNTGDDPGVRYSILAGDVRDYDLANDALMGRLIAKLGKGPVFDALYRDQGHDIAVSLDSIHGVPESREPVPEPSEVACHHLNYFVSDAGLEALGRIDW